MPVLGEQTEAITRETARSLWEQLAVVALDFETVWTDLRDIVLDCEKDVADTMTTRLKGALRRVANGESPGEPLRELAIAAYSEELKWRALLVIHEYVRMSPRKPTRKRWQSRITLTFLRAARKWLKHVMRGYYRRERKGP